MLVHWFTSWHGGSASCFACYPIMSRDHCVTKKYMYMHISICHPSKASCVVCIGTRPPVHTATRGAQAMRFLSLDSRSVTVRLKTKLPSVVSASTTK